MHSAHLRRPGSAVGQADFPLARGLPGEAAGCGASLRRMRWMRNESGPSKLADIGSGFTARISSFEGQLSGVLLTRSRMRSVLGAQDASEPPDRESIIWAMR